MSPLESRCLFEKGQLWIFFQVTFYTFFSLCGKIPIYPVISGNPERISSKTKHWSSYRGFSSRSPCLFTKGITSGTEIMGRSYWKRALPYRLPSQFCYTPEPCVLRCFAWEANINLRASRHSTGAVNRKWTKKEHLVVFQLLENSPPKWLPGHWLEPLPTLQGHCRILRELGVLHAMTGELLMEMMTEFHQ